MHLSVLDLFNSPTDSLALAQLAETLGFHRYWVGEHHNEWQCGNPLLLSALIAMHTRSIRVGTGATSLLLRSPYLVAEDALLTQEIIGGRVDLGVAPAVASPAAAKEAIAMGRSINREEYSDRVRELCAYLSGTSLPDRRLRIPKGSLMPVWLLGNARRTAQLAASLGVGLCVSFHHGISVEEARTVVQLYRTSFEPSPFFSDSIVVAAISGLAGPQKLIGALRLQLQAASSGGPPRLVEYDGTYTEAADQIRNLVHQIGANEALILNLAFAQSIDPKCDMLEGLADAWRSRHLLDA